MFFHDFFEKFKVHDDDMIGLAIAFLVTVLVAGCAMRSMTLGDLANNTAALLLSIFLVALTALFLAATLGMAHKIRNDEFDPSMYKQLHMRNFQPRNMTPEANDMLRSVNVIMAISHACFLVSAILFTWLAFWENADFAKEPVHVLIMLTTLAVAMVLRSRGNFDLGRIDQMTRPVLVSETSPETDTSEEESETEESAA